MRVKLEVVPHDEYTIFVSQGIKEQLDKTVTVSFGSLSVIAQVQVKDTIYEHDEKKTDSIGEDVEIITISSRLKNDLLIQEHLPYQIKLLSSHIEIGPVIGILLRNSKKDNKTKTLKRNKGRFSYYNNIGGLICKFKPRDIHFDSKLVEGHYYNFDKSVWEPGIFPLPNLIYLRSFHIDKEIIRKLKEITNNKIYNSYRFNKFELYQYLNEDPLLRSYLPDTEVCSSIPQILEFLKKHKNIILKPVDLSRGRGICIIHTLPSCFKISDYREKTVKDYKLATYKSLILFLMRNKSFLSKYIVQKHIPLAKINGYPYDVRVVMQKTAKDKWDYMGIECRVSRKSLVTNISRGGYAQSLENAIARSFKGADYNEIRNRICELCDKLCTFIDKRTGEHYAEFGIDIAIDTEKRLWIIEVNVLPSFNGFKDIDYNLYNLILSNPLLYAASLSGFEDSAVREVPQE